MNGSHLIIAFCNSKSGGHRGSRVLESLRHSLGHDLVFDLLDQPPEKTIQDICHGRLGKKVSSEGNSTAITPENSVASLRIIVCGGDGTCGWVFTAIDRACEADEEIKKIHDRLLVCVMPLGTGNDLSRSLGWGKRYTKSMLGPRWLQRVRLADIVELDRWKISITPKDANKDVENAVPGAFSVIKLSDIESETDRPRLSSSTSTTSVLRRGRTFSNAMMQENIRKLDIAEKTESSISYRATFTNYFSFGLDAQIAATFHEQRTAHPERFSSPIKNMLLYARYGAAVGGACPCMQSPPSTLNDSTSAFKCRRPGEKEWQELALPRGTRAVIVLNLQSYAGGKNLWGRCMKSGAFGDGLLEVVCIRSIWQMARILACNNLGLSAVRIAQVSELYVDLGKVTFMQIDGEPWQQSSSSIHISSFEASKVLQWKDRGCFGFSSVCKRQSNDNPDLKTGSTSSNTENPAAVVE